ncbi:MAG: hypothetical protein Q4A92_02135, partial [Corynebacterium sp.]|nr:hypothetical protein [Corynebacterium sp.]
MSTRDVPGTKPKRGIDLGQILMGVMVALALLTGVIGLFSDSIYGLKLAMITALWACLVAAFLVANRRKQYDEELLKNQRSIDADRMRAQQDYQRQLNEQREETLESIRGQLDAMRNQLEELSGVMLAYEPAALKAEARRIPAIELDSSKPGASFSKETEALIPVVPEPVEVDVEDSFISEPLAKKPDYVAKPFAKPTAGPSTTTSASAAPRFNSGAFSSTRWDAGGIDTSPPAPESRHASDNPFRTENAAHARPQTGARAQTAGRQQATSRPADARPSSGIPGFSGQTSGGTSSGFSTGSFGAQTPKQQPTPTRNATPQQPAAKPKPEPKPQASPSSVTEESSLRSRYRSSSWQEPERANPRPTPSAAPTANAAKPKPKQQPKPQPKP